MLGYPQNTVWYIEARPWSGPKDGTPFPASYSSPVSQGSGVVISINSVEAGRPSIKNYLLTCAHVVRRKEDDALLQDIICFPPGSNYVETRDGTRSAGEFEIADHVRVGRVSKLSPCGGLVAPRNPKLRDDPADDWVLIEIIWPITAPMCREIKQEAGGPVAAFFWADYEAIEESQFQNLNGQVLSSIAVVDSRKIKLLRCIVDWAFRRLVLIGYAGGKEGFKGDGSVEPIAPENFKPRKSRIPGIIDYVGPDEARPGMSGGGIFRKSGVLVAIHRHSTDATMVRGAVSLAHIGEWCRRERAGAQLYDIGVPVWTAFWRKCLRWGSITMVGALLLLWVLLETGMLCDVCRTTTGLRRTLQMAWHSRNLHFLLPELNAKRVVSTLPETIRCYQEITLRPGDSSVNKLLIIPEGGALIVSPGCSLNFGNSAGIIVRGKMSANGTHDNLVTFSAKDRDGGWLGVAIDGADGCAFKWCRLDSGRGHRYQFSTKANDLNTDFTPKPNPLNNDGIEAGGALSIYRSKNITFNNVEFCDNSSVVGGAVYISQSHNLRFRQCQFSRNLAFSPSFGIDSGDRNRGMKKRSPGGGVFIQASHDTDFESCSFEENCALAAYSCGGAIYVGFGSSCNIKNCDFSRNVSANTGGAIYAISLRPLLDGVINQNVIARIGQPKLDIAECRFANDFSLLHLSGPALQGANSDVRKIPWAYTGCEIASDDGFHTDVGQTSIVNQLGGKRLIHADDPHPADGVPLARTSLRVWDSSIASIDPGASRMKAFEASTQSELIISEGAQVTYPQVESIHPTGILGISDELLMPKDAMINGQLQRYYKAWEQPATIPVDTIVVHHVSALSWDSDPLNLSEIMAGKVSEEALATQGDARVFSPELCRAIFMAYGVSCHYMIDRSGRIFRLVSEDNSAYHAGKSRMPSPPDSERRDDVNKFSIGIELIGLHPDSYSKLENAASGKGYTESQYRSLNQLICLLGGRYPIRAVVGHDEIAGAKAIAAGLQRPDEKRDPGPDFEWERVRRDDLRPVYSIK